MAIHISVMKRLKNGKDITIRSANSSDAQELTNYMQRIYQTSEYLITQDDEFDEDIATREAWIKDLEEARDGLLLIALDDSEIVGSIDFKNNDKRKRISHRGSFGMSVDERHRGLGIGRALLETLITWTQRPDSSIEKIELGVLAENVGAIKLYEGLGFQREGTIKKAAKISPGEYFDEIQMALFIR